MISFEREVQFCPYCGHKITKSRENGRERYYCAHCKLFIYKNPVPVVVVVVFNDVGEVLLVKRKEEPEKGKWALPSGFVEINEAPYETASRELYEETGIMIEKLTLINVYQQKSKRYESVIVISYLGFSSEVPQPGDDAEDAKFFAINELPEIPFESHTKAIKEALSLL
ncbi:MAG: NUDIX domain-containing protein [bacterium]|nr:NUDIX domain-containing protein [bacterium]